ncbi:hypothetical protein [Endozoicomonas sp. ISHI1]|uniref:hypothetical protein n=1 Tax=Endozoicomonas sp. ISHI1 TaxID=2825882 RepID=UPI002148B494|nr:hypothetical protein [Endozoicomonas sp. ISHI1]
MLQGSYWPLYYLAVISSAKKRRVLAELGFFYQAQGQPNHRQKENFEAGAEDLTDRAVALVLMYVSE